MAKTYAQMIAEGLITFPSNVDDATKALIFDWFQYREVNDNTLFPNMFKRTLAMSMRKYNQLLRIQPGQPFIVDGVEKVVTYDWLVQSYREALTEEESTGSDSYTLSGTKTGGGTDTRTIRTTGTDTTDRDTTSSNSETRNLRTQTEVDTSYSGSSSSRDQGSSSGSEMSLGKSNPQSISYAGATGGMPQSLDWTYPGSQGENKNSDSHDNSTTGSENSSGDTDTDQTQTGTIGNSGTGTEDITVTHNTTVTDTLQHGLSDSNSETRSGSNSGNKISKNIESGRSVDSATLLANAKDFILGSSAWDYLYAQIDKNFQGLLMEW